MQVGTENISTPQKEYLERAQRRGRPALDLVRSLMALTDDDDIRHGREDIHPDWLNIFQENKDSIEKSVPLPMFQKLSSFFENVSPFDPRLAELDPQELNISFLLGAGASKPPPSDIPTVKELLPQLLERARRLDREDVTKLSDFCEQRKIDNIEDLLTAAQLATFCSRSSNVLRLMNYLLYRGEDDDAYDEYGVSPRYRRSRETRGPVADLSSVAFLQDTLQVLFGLLSSTMLPAKPNSAHQSIAQYVKKKTSSSIITTNYDCCIDLALGDVNKDFHYMIDFSNAPENDDTNIKTKLIKLHGSLNWYYCETCQEILLVDIRQTVKHFLEDKSPYPIIGICRDCGGQRRGLLVPPLAMKFDVAPPLTPLLTEAKAAFESADLILVVGFSFADADVYISRMLSKSMQMSANQKLVVADPDGRIVERIRRKFKASIPNFDPQRISRMMGDCSVLLPRFLSGGLREDQKVLDQLENALQQ